MLTRRVLFNHLTISPRVALEVLFMTRNEWRAAVPSLKDACFPKSSLFPKLQKKLAFQHYGNHLEKMSKEELGHLQARLEVLEQRLRKVEARYVLSSFPTHA